MSLVDLPDDILKRLTNVCCTLDKIMLANTCTKMQTIVSDELIIKSDDMLKLAHDIMYSPNPNIYFKMYPEWLHSNLTEFFMLTYHEDIHDWRIYNASLWYDETVVNINNYPFHFADMIVRSNGYSFVFNVEIMINILEKYIEYMPGILETLCDFIKCAIRPHWYQQFRLGECYPRLCNVADFFWVPEEFVQMDVFRYYYPRISYVWRVSNSYRDTFWKEISTIKKFYMCVLS